MKNAFLTIAITTLVAASVTGCDFFRRLAGRPDSEWIEAKAETIRQEEETQRIRLDSLEKARKAEADSLAAADSVRLANHRYRVCPTDDEAQAKKSLEELQRQDFCPKGAWILERKQ